MNPLPTFQIRSLRAEDGPAIYDLALDPRAGISLYLLPSVEYAAMVESLMSMQPGQHRLVAEVDGRVIGLATLTRSQRPRRVHSAALELLVDPEHWLDGVADTLLEAALRLADDWLQVMRLETALLPYQQPLLARFSKRGFVEEGRRRQAVFTVGALEDEIVLARFHGPLPDMTPQKTLPIERRSDVERVEVRPLRLEDAEALHEMLADPLVTRGLLQVPSIELVEVQERVRSVGRGLYRFTAVAHHEDGTEKVIGNVALHQTQNPRLAHSAGLGINVHRDYWGIGAGRQLMAAVVDLADNWLNLQRLELHVYTDNDSAIRLYERHDFQIEGRQRLYSYGDGRWSDAYLMGRLRGARPPTTH